MPPRPEFPLRHSHGAPLLASALALAALSCDSQDRQPVRVTNGATEAATRPAPQSESERLRVTPMGDQLVAMATLVPRDRDALGVPANVDPLIWRAMVPADNEMTVERIALGRRLFFDTRLSADNTVACGTCHDVQRGFVDHRPVSEGIRQQLGRRNAPTTLNSALLALLFLDGRAPTLEAQAQLPITNPIEMGQPDAAHAVAAIAGLPDYREMFQRAYGREPNMDDIGRAIAAFERTMIFLDAPFDRFTRGDANAMSADARTGWELFNGKARCNGCHQVNPANPLFTENRFHNIGIAARHQNFVTLARRALAVLERDPSAEAIDRLAIQTDMSELGRFMVTRNTADVGGFRTSQLRNIGITGPYMHDGSLATLWDVMDHYNKGGEANPYLDGGIQPLDLSEREIDQIVAFMFALTSDRLAAQNQAELDRQRGIARTRRPFRDDALAHRRTLPFEPGTSGANPGETSTTSIGGDQ